MEELDSIVGYRFATVNGRPVESLPCLLVYHGTSDVSPSQCRTYRGLPARGTDIELIRQVEPPPARSAESAFRGTMNYPESLVRDVAGACGWAGERGWVFEIRSYRGYDVESLLDLRIPDGKGGFRSPLMKEQEIAIAARVPERFIVRIGDVVEGRRGLAVDWGNA